MKLKNKISLTTLLLASCTSIASANPQLVFVADLIRHGDRTPTEIIPTSPYAWPQGLGQLTAKGMQQEYQLGQKFRELYVKQFKLLPEHYERQTMYVRSSDMDRTLMSAESLLYGLYPTGTGPLMPFNYQPIPIHTIPTSQDTLLTATDADKKEFKLLFKKYVVKQKEWQQWQAKLQPNFKRWSDLSGLKIDTLKDLTPLVGNYVIRQIYHIPMPPGFTAQDKKEFEDLYHWQHAFIFKQKPLAYFMGHTLVDQVTDYMQQVKQGKTPLKFVLFSAHDSTILGVMSFMGVSLNENPHYASDVKFELYKEGKQQYFVKLTFNGKPIDPPICHKKLCSLEQFSKLSNG